MKIAFIGLGSIARKHIVALRQINKDAIIYAVRHQKGSSEKEGIKNIAFSDLKNINLDAIIITNPSVYHAQNIIDLVDLGIPLMVEKPICVSNDQWSKLNELSTRNTPLIYTACNLRFHPLIKFLKDYLKRKTNNI